MRVAGDEIGIAFLAPNKNTKRKSSKRRSADQAV
jgi:hypothetical protein